MDQGTIPASHESVWVFVPQRPALRAPAEWEVFHFITNTLLMSVPASYVVACAVILQVLDLRPLVTMTANSYMVFGLSPVTV